jgi:peptide/nickel transport system substrate-binding protein
MLVVVVLLGGALTISAEDVPRYGGTLIFAAATEQSGLDPANVFDTAAMRIARNIAENLTNLGPDGEPVPGLAESWDLSDNGLTWVFHLRKDVTFHDGTPFNAQAVFFNFDRQMNPDNPYYEHGPWGWWDWMYAPIIKSVQVLDEFTIKMELNTPFSPLLAHLAISASGTILSPAAIEKWGAEIGIHPVGTGPFKFKEWVRGDHVTLEAFDDYWGGRPYLDEVIIKFIPDNTVRGAALAQGEVDLITDFSSPTYQALSAVPGVELIAAAPLNMSYLVMNTEKKPFDDVLVRLAVQYAINKNELVSSLYGELGEVFNGPVPSPEWAYHADLQSYDYNPEISKALLAAAGYPNGFDTELWIYSAPRGYNPVGPELAEVIQAYLGEVGINAKVVVRDYTAHSTQLKQYEHEMAFFGWYGDDLDPDEFIYIFCRSTEQTGTMNLARYKNARVDELLDRARTITDITARRELYLRAQEIIAADAAWVWLNGIKQPYAFRSRVKNFHPNPVPWCLYFGGVWVSD